MAKLTMRFCKGKLVSSEVAGVQGPDCLKETKKFLDGLRLNPTDYDDVHKPEFDMPSVQHQEQGQG